MKDVQPAQDFLREQTQARKMAWNIHLKYNFIHKLPEKMVIVNSILEKSLNGHIGTTTASDGQGLGSG